MSEGSTLRPLTDAELAWIEASAAAAVERLPPAIESVRFDDPPDGVLALMRHARP